MARTARLALAAAGLAALGLAVPAHAASAASTLVVTDPTGDSLAGTAGDITKLTYTTKGKTVTKRVGPRLVKSYTPDTLVIKLETADDIDTSGTTTYEIDSELAGCNSGFDVWFTPGVDGSEGGGCTNADASDPTSFTYEGVDGPPIVAGKSLTWSFRFKSFSGKKMKVGSTISGVHAYSALVEPLTGIFGPYLVDTALANDNLTTDRAYKVA